jgi:DNA invertase Pin-like site-specific DNA recombinase
MWRVAVYGHEAPGDRCRARLDRQVLALASHVARQSDWCHVATYADIWPGARYDRPGLLRLVGDAGPVFDLVVIEDYQRLARRRRDQQQITQHLAAARAAVTVLRSPVGRRLAATLLNVALADLVCESAR